MTPGIEITLADARSLRDHFAKQPFRAATIAAFESMASVELTRFQTSADVSACVRTMVAAGAADLAFGRLFEGHVNALQLIRRYGKPRQFETMNTLAGSGARLGVWNSDLPGEPLQIIDGKLRGAKNFASGAGLLSHALVSTDANDPERCQLYLVSLDPDCIEIDDTWWKVAGMARTNSHIVRWTKSSPDVLEPIGGPGDYQSQPFFSAGALRFVAVQAGGIALLYEIFREHLDRRERSEHPQQERRLARAFANAQSAIDTVLGAASRYDEHDADLIHRVSAARLSVMELARDQTTQVQAGVGVEAMMHASPVHRPLTDLMTYICQPNPDGAASTLAQANADLRL